MWAPRRGAVVAISPGVPRSFGDYKITVDDHELPAGVTLERLAG